MRGFTCTVFTKLLGTVRVIFEATKVESKTKPYIQNLITKEKKSEQDSKKIFDEKHEKIALKYYMSKNVHVAYRMVKNSRYMKYVERDKAIRFVTKANMERRESERYDGIDEVRLVLKNIFTTFVMDPRHQNGAKFEVIAKPHVKTVLNECGIKISKVRYEIFMNRLGLNNGSKNNVSFDEFLMFY